MRKILFMGLISVMLSPVLSFQSKAQSFKKYFSPGTQSNLFSISADKVKQGSNLKVWMSNQGVLGGQAWDTSPSTTPDGFGCEYPASSGIEHLYGAGLWVGAIINGSRYVTQAYNGSDARKEFSVSSADTPAVNFKHTYLQEPFAPNRKGIDDDNDGMIDEDELDGIDNDGDWVEATDDLGSDGLPDSLETGCQGGYDPFTNPDPAFDNFEPDAYDYCHPSYNGFYPKKSNKNVYTQGNRLPDHGEPHVDEDYGAISNSDYFCTYTDTLIIEAPQGHRPMGIKVVQKSYAWNSGTAADAIIVFEYSIINIGENILHDVYAGFFADMDIGPVSIQSYIGHNYGAFDQETGTMYEVNPVDTPSTPLGITMLDASKPLDSLRTIFRTFSFDVPCGSSNDSLLYNCMTCQTNTGNCLDPDQNSGLLGDARVLISVGPFNSLNPGDTIHQVIALVSGESLPSMLVNARKAKRLYRNKYFVMPQLRLAETPSGDPQQLSWDAIEQSPYGDVTGYRIYYGTTPGIYTDSITLDSLSLSLDFLSSLSKQYYFGARAIDIHGNESALSDEVNNVPGIPQGLKVVNDETFLFLDWDDNLEADIEQYRVIRKTEKESTWTTIAFTTESQYTDTMVWGDQKYLYRISSIDHDSLESDFSVARGSNLIPPRQPKNLFVAPSDNVMRLCWTPNIEPDLESYKIYRKKNGDTTNNLVATLSKEEQEWVDTLPSNSSYEYYIEAKDTTDAVSIPSATVIGEKVSAQTNNILVLVAAFSDNRFNFIDRFLGNYTFHKAPLYFFYLSDPYWVYKLYQYSSVIIIWDDSINVNYLPSLPAIALQGYVRSGGKVAVIGNAIISKGFEFWYPFLHSTFGVDLLTELTPEKTFFSATGNGGMPDVSIDTAKLSGETKRLGFIDRFPNALPEQVVYSYHSNPIDPLTEGKAVGLKPLDSTQHAYYFSFPLYYLDSSSAAMMLGKILTDFGEVPLAVKEPVSLPESFELFQNFPNPFNPATLIRYRLPVRSHVTLKVYDVLGKEISTLVDALEEPGYKSVQFPPGNFSSLPTGVYFYRLIAVESATHTMHSDTKKLLLTK